MSVTWDAGTAISGQGDVSPGATFWRVELDTIPAWLSVTSDTPPRYRFLGRVGAIDGDYRTSGEVIVYANQEGPAGVAENTGLYWVLTNGVAGTLYRGVGTMSADQPACRIYSTSAQTLTTGVNTPLTFNSEREDDWGMHDPAVNPTRITVAIPGWYLVGGSVRFNAHATGTRRLSVVLNGGDAIVEQFLQAVSDAGNPTRLAVTTAWYANAGDYLELWAAQGSGGNLDVTANVKFSPEFYAVKVA